MTKAANTQKGTRQKFPIVGIGASAGGLEAITTLLRALPEQPNMTIVLVQYLDPTHACHGLPAFPRDSYARDGGEE